MSANYSQTPSVSAFALAWRCRESGYLMGYLKIVREALYLSMQHNRASFLFTIAHAIGDRRC